MIEFGQPAALWTGLAVGLPILAHMAYQTVTQKHAFPSLRFIQPSSIPRTGRKTPSDLLLLLLRILLFLFITLLLADPYWQEPGSTIPSNQEKQTVIAIDVSPSMAGWNGLADARDIALGILKDEDAEYGLVSFGAGVLETLDVGTNPEVIIDKIQGLSHDWRKGNAQALLDRLPEVFSEAAQSKKVVILSDFQGSDWQSAYRDLAADGISFELVPVGMNEKDGGRSQNQSIIEAKAVPVGADNIRVWVVVRNWQDSVKAVDLSLYAGGEKRDEQSLQLNPLASAQAQFILPAGDFSRASVRLEGNDDYSLDDERNLWLKAPPPRRFGFWVGNPNEEDTRQEQEFLETAVLSTGDSGWNRWELNQDIADGQRLGDRTLNMELLFILGLADWFDDESLAENLTFFLEDGGVALVTPSEPFSASVSLIKKTELMELSFSKVAGGASRSSEVFRVAALAKDSSLNELFSGTSARDLYLTSFKRYGVLKNINNTLRIPLQTREGDPLAVVREYESGGRLVFLPFRVNPNWTDLPLRNSFLPLLMELVKKGMTGSDSRAWPILEPGELWTGNQVFEAEQPGTFRFEDQWIEVIPSPAESSPEVVTSAELDLALGGKKEHPQIDLGKHGSALEPRHSLWLWFAIVTSILLFTEMIWCRPKLKSLTGGNQSSA